MEAPVFAIDPGPEQSGWCILEPSGAVNCFGVDPNRMILGHLDVTSPAFDGPVPILAIEAVSHYGAGMAVGASVFDTCTWIGRFLQFSERLPTPVPVLIRRPDVKLHLCESRRAKDAHVRAAILDRYGGSMKAAKGTKANPGPLYGVSGHVWSALAVALAVRDVLYSVTEYDLEPHCTGARMVQMRKGM